MQNSNNGTTPIHIGLQYFAEPAAPAAADPTAPATAPATTTAEPAAPATVPAPTQADPPAEPTAKTYTEAELEDAKQKALDAFKAQQEASKDYDKMTPEQKVAYLEAQAKDKELSDKALQKLNEKGIDASVLPFIKGKDEADTEARINSFKTLLDAQVQAGVEARFKAAGTNPPAADGGNPLPDASSAAGSLHDALADAIKIN